MRPIMEKASGILGTVVPVYDVDGDANKQLISELGVRGFPTVFLLDNDGELHEYNGPRTVDGVTSFVCNKVSCPRRR